MLVTELSLALVTVLFASYGSWRVFKSSWNSPIHEDKLLTVGMVLLCLMFVGLIFPAWLHPSNGPPNPIGALSHTMSFLVGQLGVYCITLSLFLPIFESRYRHITFLILISFITFASAFINFFTIRYDVIGTNIRVEYEPIGLAFFLSSLVVLIVLSLHRVFSVIQLLQEDRRPVGVTTKSLLVLTFLLILMTITLFVPRFFPHVNLPGFSWLVPASLVIMYLAISVSKNPAFFFMTASKLDAILIIHQRQGLTLYSRSFRDDYLPEDVLSSIFSALNISLSKAIQADSRLEEVRFGDKIVILSPGKVVTTALIVSKWNFITDAITKAITREFEKRFENILLGSQNKRDDEKLGENIYDLDVFKSFDDYISCIRKNYLPL